jgi:DNA (cytosine-5)-methyltransferase 1
VDNTKKSPTILSLCSGYGGIEIGIQRAIGKCTVLTHVEVEAFAVANLVNKMETGKMDPAPIWTDVKTFDPKPFRNCIDILTGGYPCQPFSFAGKRNGEDDPRHLWPYIRSIVFHSRPNQVFFENVEGHLTKGIAEVLEDLEKMGYQCQVGIFSAVEVGAPHQRKRVFILGNSIGFEPWFSMADSSNRHGELEQVKNGSGKGSKLGNSESDNKRGLSKSTMHRERFEARGSGGDEMGNTNQQGLEIRKGERENSEATEKTRPATIIPMFNWPSGPGQKQYEWEEPRTVRDSTRIANRHKSKIEQVREFEKSIPTRETQSELGRTINGASNRVDRLRLLGNGVVPQVAEKAYITLSRKLNA